MLGLALTPTDRAAGHTGATSLQNQVTAIALAAGGALYDPSDLTSLYQSRTGGSTGATGQPVGIMLDKSNMGGQTAAAFIAGQAAKALGSWTPGSGTTVGGGGELIFSAATSSSYADPTLQNGKTYQLVFTVSGFSAGQVFPKFGSSSGPVAIANGTYTYVGLCASGAPYLYFSATGFTGTVTVISLKEIPGFHAIAPSDAARPVLTSEVIDGVTYWYLATDGVDDVMVATPALDLTTTWWGVGAWRIDAVGNRYLFGVAANTAKGAAKASTNTVQWRNTDDTGFSTLISTVTLSVPAVLGFQQTAPTVLSGRKNRVDGSTIGCLDTTALSRGLALFADRGVGAFGQFFTGRFYGGVWGSSTISTTNRDLVERLIAQRAGVAL